MAIRYLQKRYGANSTTAIANDATGRAILADLPNAAAVAADLVDFDIKYNRNGTIVALADLSSAQTFTNKTFTSPILNSPSGTGFYVTQSTLLTENGAGTSYTATHPIPAGAVLTHVRVIAQVLWNGTSASLTVGDTASANGYFLATNLKATDLLVGEVLDSSDESLWGGKNGAYLVAATGQRGPTATNFGQYYVAGSNINFVVTPGAADGSAGRTLAVTEYVIPRNIAQVAV